MKSIIKIQKNPDFQTSKVYRLAVFIFLFGIFFSIQGTTHFENDFSAETPDVVKSYQEGSLIRQVALLSLGLLGFLSLLGKSRRDTRIQGVLGWVIIFYVVWAMGSVAWADDLPLSAKRFVAFAMICLGAWATAQRFSFEDMPLFVVLSATLNLVIGFFAELVMGTFHPFATDFRFSGLLHPNAQSLNCALLLLVSVFLAGGDSRYRHFFLGLAVFALFFLILTKSRTTFLSAMISLFTCWVIVSSISRKLMWGLIAGWSLCFIVLFLGESIFITAWKGLLLGRGETEVSTLTGRTLLWEESLKYAMDRPLLGYGFNAFWNAYRVNKIGNIIGWTPGIGHSNYLDQLLELGIIGLISYVLILSGGIKCSFKNFVITNKRGYLFAFSLLIFILFIGLLETTIPYPSLLTFLFIWVLSLLAFASRKG
jgi:exopolysaccharide production protein ExoQ